VSLDLALLLLRTGIGIVFLAHGIKHALRREKTINWFESIGFRSPGMQWFFMTATEIGVGALLVAGLLTSLAAAGVVATMFVAFWSVHRKAGFWITARPDEGWEYVAILSLAATLVAVTGPGEWSLDQVLSELWRKLDGKVGLILVAAGAALGAVQLLLFWRPSQVASEDPAGS
jgi:putative oxidoreductase